MKASTAAGHLSNAGSDVDFLLWLWERLVGAALAAIPFFRG
jgi:hypothetical protein